MQSGRVPVDPKAIHRMFSPRSIAFVGASAIHGKWGNVLFRMLQRETTKETLYLVIRKAARLREARLQVHNGYPEPVDLAVVQSAANVLELIPQFKTKGVKAFSWLLPFQ